MVTFYNAPQVDTLKEHYINLPRKLENEGVDPDDFSVSVHQRPSRVPRVDRRVGLDEVSVAVGFVGVGLHVTLDRTHNPHRDRRLGISEEVAEGIPDGHHPLANDEVI